MYFEEEGIAVSVETVCCWIKLSKLLKPDVDFSLRTR
jgi:hypothetical protein